MKWSKKPGVVILFLIITLISIFNVNYFKENHYDEENSLDIQTVLMNDIKEENGHFVVTGNDPFVAYSVESDKRIWNGNVRFAEALGEDTLLQVFYAEDMSLFSEKCSFLTDVKKGSTDEVIVFPQEKISHIRIDVVGSIGDIIPSFTMTLSENNIVNYIKAIFSIHNVLQIVISIAIYYLLKRIWCSDKYTEDKRQLMILWGIVSVMFMCLYHKFIGGDYVYMYMDAGMDTVSQYWPRYIFSLDYLKDVGNSGYALHKGFGEYVDNVSLKFINPFEWTFLTFEATVALVISLYLKILWTCGFAWAYFKKIFHRTETVFVCTILWSFGGWFVLWGQHYQFATAYAYFTSILFFLELLCEKNKYSIFFPIILALLTGHSYYFTYTIGIFCVVYLLLVGIIKKNSVKQILGSILKLAIMEIVAIILSIVQLYPSVLNFTQSSRTGALTISWLELLQPRKLIYFFTYLGRILSTNIWGVEQYSGTSNYYEMTISYASCLAIVAIVYFFQTKHWKKLICSIGVYSILIMIPLVSKLMVFDLRYRWTFVLNVGVVLIVGNFLERLWTHIENKDVSIIYKTLGLSNIVIVCALSVLWSVSEFCYEKMQIDFTAVSQICIIWGILDFLVLLLAATKIYNVKRIAIFIMLFVCVEQVFMNYYVVNERGELKKTTLEYSLYNDGTTQVIESLEQMDASLYRVNKTYNSVFYDDAYIQGFNGVSSYALNARSLARFVSNLEIKFFNNHVNYIKVSATDRYVNQLLGVKYLISQQDQPMEEGYERVLSQGGIVVYEDMETLPFGYLYTAQLDKEAFNELEGTEYRSAALMLGFYSTEKLGDYEVVDVKSEDLEETVDVGRDKLKNTKIDNINFDKDTYFATVINDTGNVAMLCVPLIYNDRWQASVNGKQVETYEINAGLIGIEIPEGEYQVEITYQAQDYVIARWITIASAFAYALFIIVWVIRQKREKSNDLF